MSKVAVIHPDLGLGGAERLIVDACLALQNHGHQVHIYTGYHNERHCFEETKNGILKVTILGSWIPRSIFGKCHALMAYLRMIYIAINLIIFSTHDMVLCDQVSACIPVLKLDLRNRHSKIVFYCHFPDKLLTERKTIFKTLYRWPLDFYEEWSTKLADIILVNSEFTRRTVIRSFPSLKHKNLIILYPCVDINKFSRFQFSQTNFTNEQYRRKLEGLQQHIRGKNKFVFFSINRFERKKQLERAIEALHSLVTSKPTKNWQMEPFLIMAGGYDQRLSDSVQYYQELKRMVLEYKLEDYIVFVESPNESEKLFLYKLCNAVIYTPDNEHFGIVPLEAMAMSKPVLASLSGGPCETIQHDKSGFLCDLNGSHGNNFEYYMEKFMTDKELAREFGEFGFTRVKDEFSFDVFSKKLEEICFTKLKEFFH